MQQSNNGNMFGRFGTAGLIAIFVSTILCAVICPGTQGHSSSHVCDKPDHSCCPKSNKGSTDSKCVDTHFVEASKYHHPPLDWVALTVDAISAIAPNPTVAFVGWVVPQTGPPQDLLNRRHILRL